MMVGKCQGRLFLGGGGTELKLDQRSCEESEWEEGVLSNDKHHKQTCVGAPKCMDQGRRFTLSL